MAKPMRRSRGVVGAGTVNQADVVQRGLAGLQHDIDRCLLVDLVLDDLAARQQVVLAEGLAVGNLVELVGAGRKPHGAGFDGAGRKRDPGGDHVGGAEAPVGRVLVPGNECRVVRVLGEEERRPAEDVGAEQVLDGVEHRLVSDQPVERRHDQMGPVAHSLPPLGEVALGNFDIGADRARLRR